MANLMTIALSIMILKTAVGMNMLGCEQYRRSIDCSDTLSPGIYTSPLLLPQVRRLVFPDLDTLRVDLTNMPGVRMIAVVGEVSRVCERLLNYVRPVTVLTPSGKTVCVSRVCVCVLLKQASCSTPPYLINRGLYLRARAGFNSRQVK